MLALPLEIKLLIIEQYINTIVQDHLTYTPAEQAKLEVKRYVSYNTASRTSTPVEGIKALLSAHPELGANIEATLRCHYKACNNMMLQDCRSLKLRHPSTRTQSMTGQEHLNRESLLLKCLGFSYNYKSVMGEGWRLGGLYS